MKWLYFTCNLLQKFTGSDWGYRLFVSPLLGQIVVICQLCSQYAKDAIMLRALAWILLYAKTYRALSSMGQVNV